MTVVVGARAEPDTVATDDAAAEAPSHQILLITGMSGAGKTTALKALEDLGFECIDHLPLRLLPRLLPNSGDAAGPAPKLAIGIDVRTRDFAVETCLTMVDQLRGSKAVAVQLVFLYCDEEELRRRYTATRHRHPLSGQLPLMEGIARERQILSPLRNRADLTIDTSAVNPGHLKRMLQGHLGLAEQTGLLIQVTSFSFRSGLPRDADLVFDVRFLANPYYQAHLRGLTGRDNAIKQFIREDSAYASFFDSLTHLLQPLLPRYVAEGKSYLTIAVGCTGGRHRSVFVTEELASWLSGQGQRVQVLHRDLERSGGRVARSEVKVP
ncbi:MAG: RNase adapter RapZ [Rhodospirillales bacterium]|nr:RNase adapter RapZ [Rhodospirillales bacterium]